MSVTVETVVSIVKQLPTEAAGADPAQISQATEILQQIPGSDLPSIAARLAVPAERPRPLIGNDEAAGATAGDRSAAESEGS